MTGSRPSAPATEMDPRLLSRPEAVLFDMDGVLADVSGSYRRVIVEVCAAFGVAISPGAVVAAKVAGDANDDYKVTEQLLLQAGVDVDTDDVQRRFDALYWGSGQRPGLRSNEHLIADRSMLERLTGEYELAIVTGRPRADAEAFLSEQRISHLFKALAAREDAPSKPSPAPVTLVLKTLGTPSAWLVGDTPDDMRAARGAGAVPVGVIAPGDDQILMRSALVDSGALTVLDSINEIGGLL